MQGLEEARLLYEDYGRPMLPADYEDFLREHA